MPRPGHQSGPASPNIPWHDLPTIFPEPRKLPCPSLLRRETIAGPPRLSFKGRNLPQVQEQHGRARQTPEVLLLIVLSAAVLMLDFLQPAVEEGFRPTAVFARKSGDAGNVFWGSIWSTSTSTSTSTSMSTKARCEDEDGHEHKNGCPWIGRLAPVFHLTNRGFCDSAAERR